METTGKKHTKTLDTLVPDINNLLTNLGDGKKLKVSDEQLNKFLSNIKDAIVDWTNPVKQDRSSLRMSILGRPLQDNFGMTNINQSRNKNQILLYN